MELEINVQFRPINNFFAEIFPTFFNGTLLPHLLFISKENVIEIDFEEESRIKFKNCTKSKIQSSFQDEQLFIFNKKWDEFYIFATKKFLILKRETVNNFEFLFVSFSDVENFCHDRQESKETVRAVAS